MHKVTTLIRFEKKILIHKERLGKKNIPFKKYTAFESQLSDYNSIKTIKARDKTIHT